MLLKYLFCRKRYLRSIQTGVKSYLYFVLYKCLHGFVACQPQTIVKCCSSMIAVFRALPEQTFIFAKEWCTLHLTLVFQDAVALSTQLFWTHGYTHLNVFNFPFSPSTTIHPFSHSAPSSFSSSRAANTASVHFL